MGIKNDICAVCAGNIKKALENIPPDVFERTEEIRIREGRKIKIYLPDRKIVSKETANAEDIELTAGRISGYSPFAFKEFISSGFIAIKGGHRAGIAGHAVLKNGQTDMVRDINAVNIRIAHEKKGCAENILQYVYNGKNFKNTVIISPPAYGKTTVLRDLVRLISDLGINISLIDERGEICACFKGKAQCDVGENTDIFDSFPKYEGMLSALRSMAPQIIACDEIGTEKDMNAVEKISVCGVGLLCSVHGGNIYEAKKRLGICSEEFSVFVILKKDNEGRRYADILDINGNVLGKEVCL